MKKLLVVSIAVLLFSACKSSVQGSGNVVEENRELTEFHSIDVGGAYDIFLHPDSKSSLKIKADDNFLPLITSEVKNGVLYVHSEELFNNYESLELHIRIADLESIELGGAVDLRGYGMFEADEIDISVGGAIELSMEVDCKELDVDMGGACTANLKGRANSLELDGGGAVTFNAEELLARKCRIEMGGAGEATVNVAEELDIDVSGAVTVSYKGNPEIINKSASGASSVNEL